MKTLRNDPNILTTDLHRIKTYVPPILICLAMLAYGLYFSVYTVTRHQALMTQSYDLGIYAQALWNTIQGDFMRVTIRPGNIIYLQHHFAPSMLLIVPLYTIYTDPKWLLIMQSIIVASGAWPIYRLVKDISGRDAVGIGFAVIYLLFPSLQAANLYDFHEITIAAPLLIWSWYFARSGRWFLFFVFGITAVGFREEAVLFMLGMGVIITLNKSTRRYGLITLAGSGIWLIVLLIISFEQAGFNTNAAIYLSSGFDLGATPAEALRNIISNPKILLERVATPEKLYYLINLFAPVGYLPFFAWQTLFLVAPSVGLNLLGEYPLLYSPAQAQYNSLVAPFIVYTGAVGFNRLVGFLGSKSKFKPNFWQNTLLFFVLMLSFGYHFRLAHLPYSPYFKWPQITERHQLARTIASKIPKESSLSVQDNLAPHASHRRDLYVFPTVNQAEYIYLDLEWIEAYREASLADYTPQLDQILDDPQYEVVIQEQGLLLLQRVE